MNPNISSLIAGRPKFTDPQWEHAARTESPEAAWRMAFTTAGFQALHQVQGGFAVAVPLQDGRVFMAVDRFGIEPLCYRLQAGSLHFAQRADALADSNTPIDPQALFDYLYHHVIPSPRTVFQRVMRLPPGHYALFDQGRLTVAPYWEPDFAPARNPGPFAQWREEFIGLLQGAVRKTPHRPN